MVADMDKMDDKGEHRSVDRPPKKFLPSTPVFISLGALAVAAFLVWSCPSELGRDRLTLLSIRMEPPLAKPKEQRPEPPPAKPEVPPPEQLQPPKKQQLEQCPHDGLEFPYGEALTAGMDNSLELHLPWVHGEGLPGGLRKAELHKRRSKELEGASPALLFYGDSITERWIEQSWGRSRPRNDPDSAGNRQVLRESFEMRYGPAAVMAVSGDVAPQLLWRLQNGEAPRLRPRAILLHIGINDFTVAPGLYREKFCKNRSKDAGGCGSGRLYVENVFQGFVAVLRELWRQCRAPLVITELFPTGPGWPGGYHGDVVPRFNALLRGLAKEPGWHPLRVLNCSAAVLNSRGRIDKKRMPDFLHPSASGMKEWAKCLTAALDDLLGVGL